MIRTDVPATPIVQSLAQGSAPTTGHPMRTGEGGTSTVIEAPREEILMIGFAPGSDVLSSDAKALLQQVAIRLRGARQQMVVVRAFAARQGSKEYAVAIAERRVQAVEQTLARLKVSSSQVRRRNLGTEVPCSGTHCAPAARVELVFRKKTYQ